MRSALVAQGATSRTSRHSTSNEADGDLNLWAPATDPPRQEPSEEAIMAQWHDEMVDQPEADSTTYAAGWTISGLTVIGVIVAVWVLGI
jgi:hypothetical protein